MELKKTHQGEFSDQEYLQIKESEEANFSEFANGSLIKFKKQNIKLK